MKTGKVKQVAAFGKLIGICNDLGARYNPSKASIQSAALSSLLERAQQTLEAVNVARINYILAVNARKESFAGIQGLAVRVTRAASASGASAENLKDVKAIKRRFMPKPSVNMPSASTQGDENESFKKVRSVSIQDYDGLADTLGSLIKLVEVIPTYKPNEPGLQVAGLNAFLADLRSKSVAVNRAAMDFSNSMIKRNNVLYGKDGFRNRSTR